MGTCINEILDAEVLAVLQSRDQVLNHPVLHLLLGVQTVELEKIAALIRRLRVDEVQHFLERLAFELGSLVIVAAKGFVASRALVAPRPSHLGILLA